MRILIIHRVPYQKVQYERCLDHQFHEVTYIGIKEKIDEIPAHLRCTRFVRAGLDLVREVVSYVESLEMPPEILISLSEMDLPEAAKIREQLHLPTGPRPDDIERVRDKIRMKELLSQERIRVPKFLSWKDFTLGVKPTWAGQTILKPLDNSGSEGVERFDTADQAMSSWAALSNRESYEIEEYLDGQILHVDGIIRHGKIDSFVIHEYLGNCLAYAKGQPLGSIQRRRSNRALNKFINDVLCCLKIKTGAIHLELFEWRKETRAEYAFLEIAHRIGGGETVNCYELRKGIHLPTAEISTWIEEYSERFGRREDLQRARQKLKERTQRPSKEVFAFGTIPGHLMAPGSCRVRYPSDLLDDRQILELQTFPEKEKLGTDITYHRWQVPAFLLLKGKTEAALAASLKRAFSLIQVSPLS